jgi:hypothetical protein
MSCINGCRVQTVVSEAGLSATEVDFAVAFPTALFAKPVLCVQDYVTSISAYMTKGSSRLRCSSKYSLLI